MGGGGHLSGSNVHCVSPTHPNLCMSDVWTMMADRTNCLKFIREKEKVQSLGCSSNPARSRSLVPEATTQHPSARCSGNVLLFLSTKSAIEKRGLV